ATCPESIAGRRSVARNRRDRSKGSGPAPERTGRATPTIRTNFSSWHNLQRRFRILRHRRQPAEHSIDKAPCFGEGRFSPIFLNDRRTGVIGAEREDQIVVVTAQ